MAAYYRLNSVSGLTATDETGQHNGTLTGALAWVPGVEGNALQFRGGNGSPFVNCGAWQTDGPAGLSMALWVNWAGTNTFYQGLMAQRDGTMYWWIELSPDGGQLRFKTNTSPQSNLYLTAPHLMQNEWVHVAFSHDAPAKKGTIYLNGEEKLSGAWSLPTGTFSNLRVGLGVVNTADGLGTFNGLIDEAMIFQVPLSAADVKTAMHGYADPVATEANPALDQTDIPRDVTLSWVPAASAAAHDVYLGTSADAVSSADRTNPLDVLAGQAQTDTTYTPPAALEYGKTYYWRVDEVNGPPNENVFKGQVWSFTVEPYAYPVQSVTATASSAQPSMGPEKTVDGSGLVNDLHGAEATTMWLSAGVQPNWIQYEFDKVYRLHEMLVWNSNQLVESIFGMGAKEVTVEYSTDGTTWTTLSNVPEFAQAPGTAGYAANTTITFGGAMAKFVKLTINSTWGNIGNVTGLSEVRFSYVPVQARSPQPATGATGQDITATLNWRPGREAASHNVFLATDPNAVAQGTAPAQTVAAHSFDPGTLLYGTTYYWRVDEVNTVTYPGDVWSFTTQEFAAVDDFESYTDDEGSRIYESWVDGWTNGTGSVVGYLQAPFAETRIIHGGKQAMPMEYNNVNTPYYSEATRTFDTAQDWTASGADTLSVWFRGQAAGFVDNGDGSFTMSSSGTDIWNNSDQFRFAFKQLTGDGSIVARVDSVANTNGWAKAGVMIRQSSEAGSVHAFMPITPGGSSAGNGASFQRRLTANGGSSNDDNTAPVVAAPYWVKVERKGNSFTGSISADGKTWKQLGTAQTIAMANPVLIGLAVCSHDATLTTTAAFSNVSTTGTVTGSWQAVAIGAAMPSNGPAPLYLVVEDKAGKSKMVAHADPSASTTAAWTQWRIPLTDLTGVNLAAVKKLTLGVGDKADPKAGTAGTMFFDDIGYGHPVQ
jgi:hypothetical protein